MELTENGRHHLNAELTGWVNVEYVQRAAVASAGDTVFYVRMTAEQYRESFAAGSGEPKP